MSSQGALQEEAGGRGNVAMEAERLDDALLLDLKTEGGGHKPRTCKQLLDPGRGKETARGRNQPCPYLDFTSVRLILDF
jgi:hypothetical protein